MNTNLPTTAADLWAGMTEPLARILAPETIGAGFVLAVALVPVTAFLASFLTEGTTDGLGPILSESERDRLESIDYGRRIASPGYHAGGVR